MSIGKKGMAQTRVRHLLAMPRARQGTPSRRVRVLHLDPIGRAPRPIGPVDPLRHDAFKAHAAGVLEYGFAVRAVEMLGKPNASARFAQEPGQGCTAGFPCRQSVQSSLWALLVSHQRPGASLVLLSEGEGLIFSPSPGQRFSSHG